MHTSILNRKKILVVDDVEADRLLISTFLRHHGCRIYHAHDGVDGVHKARLICPDAILMDFDMPGCNGYDACKLLSEDTETGKIPVLFLSGYSTAEDKVKGLMCGAVDYIAKPFNFVEVKLRLSIHLKFQHAESPPEGGNETASADPAESRRYLDEILFRSAQVHILKSLDRAPGLQELARTVGTNTKQLNHSFKAYVGLTVYEYLREERMKEARKLLGATEMSVSEIAESVGFSTAGNFSTAFKERFGVPPSQFRKIKNLGGHE